MENNVKITFTEDIGSIVGKIAGYCKYGIDCYISMKRDNLLRAKISWLSTLLSQSGFKQLAILSALLTRNAVRVKTGSLLQVTTNYDGRFRFPHIQPSSYERQFELHRRFKITLAAANL